jgi:hypothetical protein
VPCQAPLCALNYFVVDSWYRSRRGPSFLIVDPSTGPVREPPRFTRTAEASYRFGPVRVYLFANDIARHIRPPHRT